MRKKVFLALLVVGAVMVNATTAKAGRKVCGLSIQVCKTKTNCEASKLYEEGRSYSFEVEHDGWLVVSYSCSDRSAIRYGVKLNGTELAADSDGVYSEKIEKAGTYVFKRCKNERQKTTIVLAKKTFCGVTAQTCTENSGCKPQWSVGEGASHAVTLNWNQYVDATYWCSDDSLKTKGAKLNGDALTCDNKGSCKAKLNTSGNHVFEYGTGGHEVTIRLTVGEVPPEVKARQLLKRVKELEDQLREAKEKWAEAAGAQKDALARKIRELEEKLRKLEKEGEELDATLARTEADLSGKKPQTGQVSVGYAGGGGTNEAHGVDVMGLVYIKKTDGATKWGVAIGPGYRWLHMNKPVLKVPKLYIGSENHSFFGTIMLVWHPEDWVRVMAGPEIGGGVENQAGGDGRNPQNNGFFHLGGDLMFVFNPTDWLAFHLGAAVTGYIGLLEAVGPATDFETPVIFFGRAGATITF